MFKQEIDAAKSEPLRVVKNDKLQGLFLPVDFIEKTPQLKALLQDHMATPKESLLGAALAADTQPSSLGSDKVERCIEELRFFRSK